MYRRSLAVWKAAQGYHASAESLPAEGGAPHRRRGHREGAKMDELILTSPGENCSLMLGARIGEQVESGEVIALWGELGSGKTLFTRGIARGMGRAVRRPAGDSPLGRARGAGNAAVAGSGLRDRGCGH